MDAAATRRPARAPAPAAPQRDPRGRRRRGHRHRAWPFVCSPPGPFLDLYRPWLYRPASPAALDLESGAIATGGGFGASTGGRRRIGRLRRLGRRHGARDLRLRPGRGLARRGWRSWGRDRSRARRRRWSCHRRGRLLLALQQLKRQEDEARRLQCTASQSVASTIPAWITDEETTGIVHVRSRRWIASSRLTIGGPRGVYTPTSVPLVRATVAARHEYDHRGRS